VEGHAIERDRFFMFVLVEMFILLLLLTACSRSATCFNAGVTVDKSGRLVTASADGLASPNSDMLKEVHAWPGPSGSKLVFSAQQYAVSDDGNYLYLRPSLLVENRVGVLGLTLVSLDTGLYSPIVSPSVSWGAPVAPTLLAVGQHNKLFEASSDGTVMEVAGLPALPAHVTRRKLSGLREQPFLSFAAGDEGTLYFTFPTRRSIGVFRADGTYSSIGGPSTLLDRPEGVAVGRGGRIFVAEPRLKAILVFAFGAEGDSKPIAVLKGQRTSLIAPRAVALDEQGRLYVFDGPSETSSEPVLHYIRVYPNVQHWGDLAPQRTYPINSTCWAPAT